MISSSAWDEKECIRLDRGGLMDDFHRSFLVETNAMSRAKSRLVHVCSPTTRFQLRHWNSIFPSEVLHPRKMLAAGSKTSTDGEFDSYIIDFVNVIFVHSSVSETRLFACTYGRVHVDLERQWNESNEPTRRKAHARCFRSVQNFAIFLV